VGVTALVVAPWLIRNWVEFDRFPVFSTNDGYTALATNCHATYFDSRRLGWVAHECPRGSSCRRRGLDEGRQSACMRAEARRYVRQHVGRVPLVVVARVERLWELRGRATSLRYGELVWGRTRSLAIAGLVMYALLLVPAVVGALALRRDGVPLTPLLATFALVTVVAAGAFGFTRYRLPAEPALVVLGAVGLERLARRTRGPLAGTRGSPRLGEPAPGRPRQVDAA
jgi:hypothetical protein